MTDLDVTMPAPPPTDLLHELDSRLESLPVSQRYAGSAPLGVGGMGEVRAVRDRQIGREIALKKMLPEQAERADLRARFVREARIQGQLEHPSVVPVYDLDHDGGQAFFTMKRVRGETLEAILETQRGGAAQAAARHGRHALLSAFVRVCLAVDYAHSRGVIHRDLKPANIMLGDFGEVYVLDWGCAKIEEAPESRRISGAAAIEAIAQQLTEAGQVMGTPAFMAPEQIEGGDVDRRADVYALGGVLFEILTLEALARGRTTSAVLADVLRGVDARARARAPEREVPPELEAICVRATARAPADRYASARGLADDVERFLEGHRDEAARRAIIDEQVSRAAAASEAAAADGRPEARTKALREVGRAVALAPDDPRGMTLLADLLTTAPATIPEEVVASVEESAGAIQRRMLPRSAVATGLVGACLAPALVAFDRGAVGIAMAVAGAWILCAIVAILAYAFDENYRRRPPYLALFMGIATAVTTLLFGPLVLAPTLAVGVTAAYTASIARRHRALLVAVMACAFLVPAALGAFGLHPVDVGIDGRTLTFHTPIHLPRSAAFAILTAMHVAVLGFSVRFVALHRDALTAAETKNQVFAWQLAQLVPRASAVTAPRGEAPS